MKFFFSVSGISISVVLLAILVTIFAPKNLAWADTIQCGSADCGGTDQRDNMVGDDNSNSMFAFGDNDVLTGKGSGDVMSGGVGDDVVSGGKGSDQITGGGGGADRLTGGDDDDKIRHSDLGFEVQPDGSKDIIDCGAGNDEVWINVSVDHDTASGCEIVHTG